MRWTGVICLLPSTQDFVDGDDEFTVVLVKMSKKALSYP